MKKFSFNELLSALMVLLMTTVNVACSSEEDGPDEPQSLDVSQVVGCWKVPISDTVTEYWQFSTAVDSETEEKAQSRTVSIDTPSGTYINTRVTETPENHTRVMELLAYGAYKVNALRHEIVMTQGNLSDYDVNFKVTLIDDQLTLDSDTLSGKPLVLVNVNREDSNNDTGYASALSNAEFSFEGFKLVINGEWCTFLEHPKYKGFDSELIYSDYETGNNPNMGRVSFKKTGKNTATLSIRTSEWTEIVNDEGYGFDGVNIELNLQFWGNEYGIVKSGKISRSGKHYVSMDHTEYIENETVTFGSSVFGAFPY